MPAAMAFSQLLLDHSPLEVASESSAERGPAENAPDENRERPTAGRVSPKNADTSGDR